eukprot:scaffold12430_cov137-Skeletonema_marinoi.AAC.32
MRSGLLVRTRTHGRTSEDMCTMHAHDAEDRYQFLPFCVGFCVGPFFNAVHDAEMLIFSFCHRHNLDKTPTAVSPSPIAACELHLQLTLI